MWFKKNKETHIYNSRPVEVTGRYYTAKNYAGIETTFVEIKEKRMHSWVPTSTLYEIKTK